MKLKTREVYGAVIVEVDGHLVGGPESPKFHAFFKKLLDADKTRIVVSLKNVPWANSQGVGMLIGAHAAVRKAGGELVLAHVADKIESIFTVARLMYIFKWFDTEDEAIEFLKSTEGRG